MQEKRESLGSRLGFILLSVGCAVGLGNIWRFPYVTGVYGGGIFVLLYLVFLVIFGYPLLNIELAIGRAGRANLIGSMRNIAGEKKRWIIPAKAAFVGNLLLMMFYTTISGWLFAYAFRYISGAMHSCSNPKLSAEAFGALAGNGHISAWYMILVVTLASVICACGLRKGVEGSVKVMMCMLFILIFGLAIYALTLPNAMQGVKFYLYPNFNNFTHNFGETFFAAMGQAFFTLSLGAGSMTIFGSYVDKKRSLSGETVTIIALDTMVALMAGLIIFPICASFGVDPGQGPNLIFVSLPPVFATMQGGRFFGSLFFIFMSLAALTTVVAVLENLIAYFIDEHRMPRPLAALLVCGWVILLSLPCVLGFNLWQDFQPLGSGSSVLDLEDFIVSQNILPLGSLLMLIFVLNKKGMGWQNFMTEVNTGNGMKFSGKWHAYLLYVLPILLVVIFLLGYIQKFFTAR